MIKHVIYKVDLNDRNKFFEFRKVIVDIYEDLGEALISLTNWRMNNNSNGIRYTLGHVKTKQ